MEKYYFTFHLDNTLQQVVASDKLRAVEKMKEVGLDNWKSCYTQYEMEQLLEKGKYRRFIPLVPIYAK